MARRARFIERGIGVVQMNQYAARFGVARELFEQTAGSGKRQVADFARGLTAAADIDEFIVGPECAIEQREIAFLGAAFPGFVVSGNAGRVKKSLAVLHEYQTDDSFFLCESLSEASADVIRI